MGRSKRAVCQLLTAFLPEHGFHSKSLRYLACRQSYALDRDQLDAAYRELQNTVHPDVCAHPEAEQRVAMQWATRVNEAYQTLKHPVDRGVYLLHLQGIDALDANNTRWRRHS